MEVIMTNLEAEFEYKIIDVSTDERKEFILESFNRLKTSLRSLAKAREDGVLYKGSVDYVDLGSFGFRKNLLRKFIGNPFAYYKLDGCYFQVTFNGVIKQACINDVVKYPLSGIVDLEKTLTIEYVEKQNELVRRAIESIRVYNQSKEELFKTVKVDGPKLENEDIIYNIWNDKELKKD